MEIKGYIALVGIMFWAAFAFSSDFDTWETVIKNSDITLFQQMVNRSEIDRADLQGLLALADEIVRQRQHDIFERKCRVYSSIGLKLFTCTGICPIIGYCLDQRALGAILGLYSLILGGACTSAAVIASVTYTHPVLAIASALVGIGTTAYAVSGCVKLERWFWQRERLSSEKLENAYQDAIMIKTRLTALAAK